MCQAINSVKAYAKAQLRSLINLMIINYMPPYISANPEIGHLYINEHFCYVFKFGTRIYKASGLLQ